MKTQAENETKTIDNTMKTQAQTTDKPGKNKPTNRQNMERQAKPIDTTTKKEKLKQ